MTRDKCAGGARYVIQWFGSHRAIVFRGTSVVAHLLRQPDGHMTTSFEPDLSADERARIYAALLDELDARGDR